MPDSFDAMDEVEELRQLEESMWRPAMQFDRRYMGSVLAPDFFEFGRGGRTYGRDEILAMEAQEIARLPLEGFRVAWRASDVRLVTYVSAIEADRANRSSLWRRTPSGWRLRFHQGTATTG